MRKEEIGRAPESVAAAEEEIARTAHPDKLHSLRLFDKL